jgi:hypothetical protein
MSQSPNMRARCPRMWEFCPFNFAAYSETLSTLATYWTNMPASDDRWVWRIWWNMDCQGKLKYSEETCISAKVRNSLWHALSLHSLLRLYQSSGNGFQWPTLPYHWVPELTPCLRHSNSHKSQQLNSRFRPNFYALFKKAVSARTELNWIHSELNLNSKTSLALSISIYNLSARNPYKTPFTSVLLFTEGY